MTTKSKVPQVRFKGFNEEWESNRLDNIADITGGGTPSTSVSEYWNGDIDWYSPTEIGYSNYANKSQKKITQLGLEKSSAKILPAKKTILFTSRAGIGDMAILNNNGATNQGFQSLVLKDDYIPYFVYSAGYLIKNYALIHASGSTFLEISGKQLGNMNINVPEKAEQTKIGNYFQQLDKLIEQKEKKYQKLKQFKKAMIDKMFPKNGEDTPEIRFKGFSGKWEEKSIGDVFTFKQGVQCAISNQYIEQQSGQIRFIRIIDLTSENEPIRYIKNPGNEHIINEDDLFMVRYGAAGEVGYGYKGVIANNLFRFLPHDKALVFSKFYYFLFNHMKYQFIQLAGSSTMPALNFKSLYTLTIKQPNIEEQEKIGNYFQKLDKQIDLQIKEIEKLKNIKKASLDKMFV